MGEESYDYYKSAEGGSSDSSGNNSEQEERKVSPEVIHQMRMSPDDLPEEGDDDMDEDMNSCASSVIVPFSQSQLKSSELNDIQRQMLKKESDKRALGESMKKSKPAKIQNQIKLTDA